MPAMTSGLTSVGVITGVNPALSALSTAAFSSASSSRAPIAGQVVEPRAGHLGAALGVDAPRRPSPSSRWSRTGKPSAARSRLAHLLEHDVVVLAARRDAVLDDVRDLPAQLGGEPSRPRRASACSALTCSARCLAAGQQRLLLVALRLGHLLAEGLLLGPQRLELGQRGASARVGVEHLRRRGGGRRRGPPGWRGRGRDPPAGAADRSPENPTDPTAAPAPPRRRRPRRGGLAAVVRSAGP